MSKAVLVRYPDPYQPSTIEMMGNRRVDGLLEHGRASGIATTSYSEPVDDGLFTMEGNKKRSPF